MNAEIEHKGNRFIKVVDGMESILEYERYDPSTVIFYHTFVPEELRGRGLATQIIREGLDWAMKEELKIIPSCSAVKKFIERNTIYSAYCMR
ncbi:MAG: N-acetyltransferase [Bacteroidales bacterium]|nr:N-acetyltransferase [Bacteroidales bacterium]